ncbi:MAG: response regulator [Chloroflexota bacterium]
MGASAKILVVDDEPDTVGLIELTLQTAGFDVQTAISGEQALRKVRDESFDLVLLDIMMPDLSGYDVLRRINQEVNPAPPVVFLTAKSRPEDQEMGESLGAAGFLVKPTTRGDLLDAVHAALGQSLAGDAST